MSPELTQQQSIEDHDHETSSEISNHEEIAYQGGHKN